MKSGEYSLTDSRYDGYGECCELVIRVDCDRSNCATGCFPTANQGVREIPRFEISQIVKKAKTCNEYENVKLTGNF